MERESAPGTSAGARGRRPPWYHPERATGRRDGMKARLLAVVAATMAVLPSCAALQPRMGMTFNELYGQVARTKCGWLEMVSAEGGITVYRVALPNPGCDRNIYYSFQDDRLVKTEKGQLDKQR